METSFADQVKQVVSSAEFRNDGHAPSVPNTQENTDTSSNAGSLLQGGPGDISFDDNGAPINALPQGNQPQAASLPVQTDKIPAKVKIHGKEFSSMEEAQAYAEAQIAKAEGYKEAAEKFATPKAPETPAAPVKDWSDDLENEIFVNPKEAIKKLYNKAKDDAKKEVFEDYQKMQAQQQSEAQKEAGLRQYWNSFYKANPDLQDIAEEVDRTVEKNWDMVKDLPQEQAIPKIAELTRSRLNKIRAATLPKRELQSGPSVVAGRSAGPGPVGASATANSNLDFISQVRKHGKRGV